ncbi:MAG: MFS transporter [Chloroflexi bacterium]|nr:MFS transporter [Chloroflexota bacterium]
MSTFLRTLTPARLLGFGRPPDAPPTPEQIEANTRHLVWEIAWFGVLIGTTVNFLQVYVVRLGASSLLVGAITYGPALVSIFWQLPASQLISHTGRRMRWMLSGGFMQRLIYLLIALLPLVIIAGRAELTVLLLVLQAIPVTIAATSFLSMLADAVPADRLTQVVAWRMIGLGVSSTLSTLLAGQVLQRLPFPINYQVLFVIGYLASMVSAWHITQLHVTDRPADLGQRGRWFTQFGRIMRYPRFAYYVLAVGVLQLAIGMSAPLFPLFWVRKLGASDGQISLVVTTASAALVLGSLLMRRTVRKIGRELALAGGAIGYALYPLLTSFSPSVWWLVPWAALGGFFNAAVAVTLFDNLVAVTPDADRTHYIGVFNVFVNVALFAGPLLAGVLATSPGGPALGLRVAGAVGLLSGLLFVLRVRGTGRAADARTSA